MLFNALNACPVVPIFAPFNGGMILKFAFVVNAVRTSVVSQSLKDAEFQPHDVETVVRLVEALRTTTFVMTAVLPVGTV